MSAIAKLKERKDQQQRKRRTNSEIRLQLAVEDSLDQIMNAAQAGDLTAQMYMVDKFRPLSV